MSSRSAVVLLIVLFGIFAFVLLWVPVELSPEPQQTTDTNTVIKSYGATWNEIRDRYDDQTIMCI